MNEQEIRSLIGEVLIAGFDGLEPNDAIRTLIEEHQVRNVILFRRNVESLEQLQSLNANLQDLARQAGATDPLIICTDQENGIVRRVVAADLPGLPGNMVLGATNRPDLAGEVGRATARQLLAVGINMNLAPVLDVNNNALNPVIGVRSYGEDPQAVAEFGRQMLLGLQAEGVIACGKHFPGHGDTSVDSHLALPTIHQPRSRLDAVELVPFREAIRAGIDTIMTAHVVFPTIESRPIPSTISQAVLTGLLRNELGFQGVITTDCMEMNAISETIGVGQGAVEALVAGADLVMISHRLDRQIEAIEMIFAAVSNGILPLERLREAAQRVRALRRKRLAPERAVPSLAEVIDEAGKLQADITSQAVTLVANDLGLVPVVKEVQTITVLLDPTAPLMVAAGPIGQAGFVQAEVGRQFPGATVEVLEVAVDAEPFTEMPSSIQASDLIVAAVNGRQNAAFIQLIDTLCAERLPVIVIALQSPYVLSAFSHLHTSLAIYENTPWMIQAGVQALRGKTGFGRLPVSIGEGKLRGHGL